MNNSKTKFTHAELYKITTEDNGECAFPNVGIALYTFLTFFNIDANKLFC